jgi:polyhydroxyalkanoate synthesis regulator phasin
MPQAKKSGSGQSKRRTQKSGAARSRSSAKSSGAKSSGAKSSGAKSSAKSSGNDAGHPVLDLLQRGIEAPLSVVMLTNERIQEVMDDAVERGRMTRADAEDMMDSLLKRGRRQTEDFIADLEQIVGTATTAARRSKPADRMLRGVDRARRATGVGPVFPILSYDDLTAAQIAERLDDLSPAELRKVRDYERRHGNRKSVLAAIESKLG